MKVPPPAAARTRVPGTSATDLRGVAGAVGVATTLWLVASTTTTGWLALAAAVPLGLVVVAVATVPRLRELEVHASQPRPARAGEPVEVHLVLRSGRTTGPLRLDVTAPEGAGAGLVLEGVTAGSSALARVHLPAVRRGVHGPLRVALQGRDALGLLRRRRVVVLPLAVVVRPAAAPAARLPAPLPLPVPVRRTGGRPVAVRHDRAGEIATLRLSRDGDDARDVAARPSARRGRAVVLQREAPGVPTGLLLVLGPVPTSGEHDAGFEQRLAAASAAAAWELRRGDPVLWFPVGAEAPLPCRDAGEVAERAARLAGLPAPGPRERAVAARHLSHGGAVLVVGTAVPSPSPVPSAS